MLKLFTLSTHEFWIRYRLEHVRVYLRILKNGEKEAKPTTIVSYVASEGPFLGTSQSEQTGLIMREALKKQELKQPVSDRG